MYYYYNSLIFATNQNRKLKLANIVITQNQALGWLK